MAAAPTRSTARTARVWSCACARRSLPDGAFSYKSLNSASWSRWQNRPMKREDARELEHVALSVAVAVVVFRLSGEQVGGTRSPEALRLFNDVAHAMAHIVPICTLQRNGLPKELGHMEVV